MYYDLNIPWPLRVRPGLNAASSAGGGGTNGKKQQGKGKGKEVLGEQERRHGVDLLQESDRVELEKCVQMAIRLGYSTIAFNLVLPPNTYVANTIATLNPCYAQQPPFPKLDARTSASSSSSSSSSVPPAAPLNNAPVSSTTTKGSSNTTTQQEETAPAPGLHRGILQLSRLTVTLDANDVSGQGGKGNGSMFNSGNANTVAGYNIISALPLDNAAFTHVCLTLSTPGPSSVDIITLDLASSPRLPFQLKRSMVLKAIADGAVFEVCYGSAMRSAAGQSSGVNSAAGSSMPINRDARRNVIAGAREIIRITNGKGVVLSSEVRRHLEMRGPLDLCNFGTILGLKPDQAKNTVSGNARLTVIRGHAHRGTYRAVISNPTVTITRKKTRQTNNSSLITAVSLSDATKTEALAKEGGKTSAGAKRKRSDETEEAMS